MLTQPEFRSKSCTRYRFRYSECRACADACPHEAITLSDEGVAISDADCRNCALCAAVCPTEALNAGNLPRIDLLKRAAGEKRFTFACAPSEAEGDATVPCLGALDTAMLATLSAHGVAVELAGTHHCEKCPHGERGAALVASHLEGVAALRIAAGTANWAAITVIAAKPVDPSDKPHDPSRRHLFRRFIARPAEAIAAAANEVEAQPVPLKAVRFASPIATTSRELLQRLFDRARPDAPAPAPALSSHAAIFAGRVEIAADGCTACEVCARACPTGALQIAESGVGWALNFQLSRCVACGLCLEACQPRVLRLAASMTSLPAARETATLHALGKQRCSRCDRFFISPAPLELCPICAGDDEDFTAIFG